MKKLCEQFIKTSYKNKLQKNLKIFIKDGDLALLWQRVSSSLIGSQTLSPLRRGLTAPKFFASVRKVFAVKSWPFYLFSSSSDYGGWLGWGGGPFNICLQLKFDWIPNCLSGTKQYDHFAFSPFHSKIGFHPLEITFCILFEHFITSAQTVDRLYYNLVIQSPPGLARWTHKLNSFLQEIF